MQGTGWSHQLFSITQASPTDDDQRALDADAIVFSKSFLARNEALAERAKSRGLRVLFDVCDNHYDHPQYGPHYRAMSALADQVVCNTADMAAAAAGHAASAPVVIEDPFEGPKGAPRFAPSATLQLLWYGHPSNLDTLHASLSDLVAYAQERPLALTVLTQPTTALIELAEQINSHFGQHFQLAVQTWSLAAQWRALGDCDAVIIPTLQGATKQVKSANRMIEALWAGKPVVAQPLPSYAPFGRWTPVGGSLPDGCRWLDAYCGEIPGLVGEAQAYIAERYAPATIAAQWAEVISSPPRMGGE
ncbi:hypothetical protein LJR219_003679 [Phenylobacterium sp. LjRoot219]|uniref:hypothetical protein n=1 Tax=Phenylobacterium sp. LjRoot219 TaxID=3342283 RepID=UPI003ED152E3